VTAMLDAMISGVSELVKLGGPVVALLLCVSVAALAIVVLKLWQFAVHGVGRHGEGGQMLARWDRGERALPPAAPRNQLGRAVAAAMAAYRSGEAGGRERVEAEADARLHDLEKGFRALDAVVQISPLLGLFGTVIGMIEAFQKLQDAGNAVDPSILAGGIWVALLTTAVGLAVAMPASVLLTWFESRLADERVATSAAIAAIFAPGVGLAAAGPQIAAPGRLAPGAGRG